MGSEYVTLMGAEDVRRAGANISEAADQMRRAATEMEETASRIARGMEDFATRMERLAEDFVVRMELLNDVVRSPNDTTG